MTDDPELPADVVEAIEAGRKIEAIKLLRERSNLGLKEAKHAVEAYERHHPVHVPKDSFTEYSPGNRLVVIGIIIAIAYAAYRYLA